MIILNSSKLGGSKPSFEMIILSACDTDEWSTMLLNQGVKAVVTTNRKMYDKEFASFMPSFIEEISRGETLANARLSASVGSHSHTFNSVRIRGDDGWRWV